MKNSANKFNSYNILVKLIKMSDDCYGIIEYNDKFYDEFPDIPRETLFNICLHLSNRLFIDYDYCDETNFTFDKLYILPQGYAYHETRITNRINIILSLAAIIIALISLFVSLLQ